MSIVHDWLARHGLRTHPPQLKEPPMIQLQKHLNLLGMRVTDRVSGMSGVVTSVGFDLYGCIQAIVHPGMAGDGKVAESHWFDVARLEVTASEPVMPRPNFEWSDQAIASGMKGPADRPASMKS